jgi:hypothetical protein
MRRAWPGVKHQFRLHHFIKKLFRQCPAWSADDPHGVIGAGSIEGGVVWLERLDPSVQAIRLLRSHHRCGHISFPTPVEEGIQQHGTH